AGILDSQVGPGDRGQADERADLDVVRTDGVRDLLRSNRLSAVDGHGIGAYTLDLGAERDQETGEVLDVRLAGRIAQHGRSLGGRCGDEGIFRRGGAGLVE